MVVVGGQSTEGGVHGEARSMASSRVHGEVLCTDMADTGARRGYCTDTRATGEHVGDEGLVHGKEDGNGRPKRLRSRARGVGESQEVAAARSCGRDVRVLLIVGALDSLILFSYSRHRE